MKNHELKIQIAYLKALETWEKKCEIRYNDRDFQVHDTITFYPLIDKDYVERRLRSTWRITHVLSWLGLREWYVALSLAQIEHEERVFWQLDTTVAGPDMVDERDLSHSRHVIETPEELDQKIDSRPVWANRISEEDVPF